MFETVIADVKLRSIFDPKSCIVVTSLFPAKGVLPNTTTSSNVFW